MNNSNNVKDINMAAVLECLHRCGPISKGGIAAKLGVSSVTAHKLVEELCEAGLVCDCGDPVSHGGKKAMQYSIKGDFGLLLGITLTRFGFTLRLSDFNLCTVASQEFAVDVSNIERTVTQLTQSVGEIIASADKRPLAIGLSLPGSTSPRGERIELPDYPQWNSISLGALIENDTGLPVYADNDANALALAVKWLGFAAEYRSYVCVQVDCGVGVGAVIDGKLLRGATFHGGEFGHLTLDPNGKECTCGRRGCLQTYLNEKSALEKLNLIKKSHYTMNQAVDLLRIGDEAATAAFSDYLSYLRIAVENVIRVLDPEAVYLANSVAAAVPGFRSGLQTPYFEIASFGGQRRPPIELLSEDFPFGAAASAIAFEHIIKNPLTVIGA